MKIFGGAMVGLQFAQVMENMGSLLNGVVNYNTWLPEPSMYFDGTKDFFEKYTKRAVEAKVDSLGYLHRTLWLCHGSDDRAGGECDQIVSTRRASRNTCTRTP